MASSNLVILSSTQGKLNATGDPVLGTSYTQAVGSLYTVAIYASNLTGRVYVEGTLSTHPRESDWFPITLAGLSTPYIQFPYSGESSTTTVGLQVVGASFKGNLTWVRARLDRDYLNLGSPTPQEIAALGFVDRVLLTIGGTVGVIDDTPSQSVLGVQGHNLGTGAKVYSGFIGETNIQLNFKSLTEGTGIRLTETATSILIESTVEPGGPGDGVGATKFVELTDVPNTIVHRGLLVGHGTANAIAWAPAPSVEDTMFAWTDTGFAWKPIPTFPDFIDATIAVKVNSTNVVAQANSINFTGNAVAVANVAGVPTVTINHQPLPPMQTSDDNTEYVMFQYTAGGAGILDIDALVSKTDGVTMTVSDPNNCVVQFTFADRITPPTSIAVMGQVYSTNEFNFANVNPAFGTRKVKSGGTSANPDILTAFSGPITLQLRMADTGASAGVGQRAKAIVMFKF